MIYFIRGLLSSVFWCYLGQKSLIPFLKRKKAFFTSINTKNNIFTYTHLFCIFHNNPPPPPPPPTPLHKWVYKDATNNFFYDSQNLNVFSKKFRNPKILKNVYAQKNVT